MPPLQLSADEFQRLAQRVTELATDFLAGLDSRHTVSATSALSTTAAFDLPLREEGIGEAILDDLELIARHVRAPTGRRFPYVIGSGEPVGALGDLYASVQPCVVYASDEVHMSIPKAVAIWASGARTCG
jgi:aromatic-L-amino-acid/L-tryptophan decarboxylase